LSDVGANVILGESQRYIGAALKIGLELTAGEVIYLRARSRMGLERLCHNHRFESVVGGFLYPSSRCLAESIETSEALPRGSFMAKMAM
jgi:hypothetical protein